MVDQENDTKVDDDTALENELEDYDKLERLRKKREQVRISRSDPMKNKVNALVELSPEEFEKEAKRLLKAGRFVGFSKSRDPYKRAVEEARKLRKTK